MSRAKPREPEDDPFWWRERPKWLVEYESQCLAKRGWLGDFSGMMKWIYGAPRTPEERLFLGREFSLENILLPESPFFAILTKKG